MGAAPVSSITSFSKWEQAFRVFSNIYSKANPHRASELIEYNHVIHTIALAYVWENVYTYDREFRLHISKNPQRSWAMILQQAWAMRLKDRLVTHATGGFQNGGNQKNKNQEICRHFNRGRCNFGSTCKYEHHCSYCFKYGYGTVNCRKANLDRNDKGNGQGNRTSFGGD